MSPVHHAPRVWTSAHNCPKQALWLQAEAQARWEAGEEGSLQNQPMEAVGTFKSGHLWWPWLSLCVFCRGAWVSWRRPEWGNLLWPVLDMGRAPKLLPPLLAPVWGVSPRGRWCCCQLCWAQEISPKEGAGTLGELVSTVTGGVPCSAYHEVIWAQPRVLLLLWSGRRQLLWLNTSCLASASGTGAELGCLTNPHLLPAHSDSQAKHWELPT